MKSLKLTYYILSVPLSLLGLAWAVVFFFMYTQPQPKLPVVRVEPKMFAESRLITNVEWRMKIASISDSLIKEGYQFNEHIPTGMDSVVARYYCLSTSDGDITVLDFFLDCGCSDTSKTALMTFRIDTQTLEYELVYKGTITWYEYLNPFHSDSI